jgi:hypothetical protein
MKPRETLARYFLGRKFSLTVAYWFFCFTGAAIIYFNDCQTVQEKIEVFNDALEWALYGFYGFIGVEGFKEGIGMIKGNKNNLTDTAQKSIEDEES